MKCAQCGSRYSAAWAQPAPGGSSAPGALLGFAVVLLSATAAALLLDVAYVKWIGLGIGSFVVLQVAVAWADCRSGAGLAKHGGGTCPTCGADNPVRLWSL